MTRILNVFFVLIVLLASAAISLADSAKDMLEAGRIDEAIAELNTRLASAPDAASSNLLCRAYFAIGDWDGAVSACKTAVSLDPNNGRYHLWLGRMYGEKADRSNFLSAVGFAGKVRAELERAVQLNPQDVEARVDLAEFYAEAPGIVGGGQQKALAQAKALATLSPGREHWVYAHIAEKNKDLVTAEREYRQYVDLSQGDSEAWLNLALFLRRQKRFDEVEKAIVQLSHAPMTKPDTLVEAAEILYHAGRNYPLATELLRRYLNSGPVEAAPAFKAHYVLGELLELQGDKAGAAQQYRTSLSLVRNFGLAQQALSRVAR